MPKKKKVRYVQAIVLPIQPEDEFYCGDCEWKGDDIGMCHLFHDEIQSYSECETCECCGAEKLSYEKYCRCSDCIEGECLVREES